MAPAHFPRRTTAQATGETGCAIVALIVQEELGWQFRRTPQEADFGVDGYVDVITDEGYVTGKSLAVQIKSGSSYIKWDAAGTTRYRGDRKHVNYYLNHTVPVLLVIVDPETKSAWWRRFDAYETDGDDHSWSIAISLESRLNAAAKGVLARLVGPAVDYLSHLEHHWSLAARTAEAHQIVLQVTRREVDGQLTRPFARVLERLGVSRAIAESSRNKLDFLIFGFDDDPRELYEIPSVRAWINEIVMSSVPLAYFLDLSADAHGIQTILYCVSRATVVGPDTKPSRKLLRIEDGESAIQFMNAQFAKLNDFTDLLGLSDDVNRECSQLLIAWVTRVLDPAGERVLSDSSA